MRKQRGSAILTVMMLIVIVGLFALATKREQQKRDYALKAIAWSNALTQVCYAADTYATRNWDTVSHSPTTVMPMAALVGVPPLTSDTVATLNGVTVSSSITMKPVGCDPAAFQCRSDVRVWTSALPGTPADRDALSNSIVRRVGHLASQSLAANPSQFVSRNSERVDPNPSGAAGAVQVRCGEVNIITDDAGLRGNRTMTGALNAGGNNLTFDNIGTGTAQINQTAGAACTVVNSFALDSTGRYMYCNGSTWQSAAKPVTQQVTEHYYHF